MAEQEATGHDHDRKAVLVKFPSNSADARQRLNFIVNVPDMILAAPVTDEGFLASCTRAFGLSLDRIEKQNKHTWSAYFTWKRLVKGFRGHCIELNEIRIPAEVEPAEPSLLFTYDGDPSAEPLEEIGMRKVVRSALKPKFKATLWKASQTSSESAGRQSYTTHLAVYPRWFRFYLPVAISGGRVAHARFNVALY